MSLGEQVNGHVSDGTAGASSDKSCNFCERKGLPILPVRYAVCQRTASNSGIPELDESRVREFTDIMLDKSMDELGNEEARTVPEELKEEIPEKTDTQVNKYILRQLREGYLYFYDADNPNSQYWYGFAISSDGKFSQFEVAHPPSVKELQFPEACVKPEHSALKASIVSLPHVDTSVILYYAFSEHPWSLEHIRTHGADADWRDKNMQQVNIAEWVQGNSQPFAFGTEELGKVAEYSDGAHGLDTQFWSSGPRRELFTRDELKDVMDQRLDHAASKYQGKGLILAVKDEAGIIGELNAYRHQAMAEVEDFFDPGSGDEEKKLGERRRRLQLCKQAMEAFEQNYERRYKNQLREERDAEIERLRHVPHYSVEFDQAEARYQRGLEETPEALAEYREQLWSSQDELDELRAKRDRTVELYTRWRDTLIKDTADSEARYRREGNTRTADRLRSYCDNAVRRYNEKIQEAKRDYQSAVGNRTDINLEAFNAEYESHTKSCEQRLSLHDGDYSYWVKNHLPQVIGRYSEEDDWMGLGLSGVIANALRGGILSPSSAGLWKSLADDLDTEKSPILVGLFANNRSVISRARQTIDKTGQGMVIAESVMSEWGELFKSNQSQALTTERRVPTSDEIINRYRPAQGVLTATIGLSLATLATHATRKAMPPEPDTSLGDMKTPLKQFIQYQLLAFMTDPDAQEGHINIPRLVDVKVTRAQLHQWLKVATETSEKGRKGADLSAALKSLNGASGNFAVGPGESDELISISLPSYGLSEEMIALLQKDPATLEGEPVALGQARMDAFWSSAQVVAIEIGKENKGPGQIIAAGLLLWNVISALTSEDFMGDDQKSADWSAILGMVVNGATGTMQALGGIAKVSESVRLSWLVNHGNWNIAGKGFGVAGGLLALWDGVTQLTNAADAARQGRTISEENARIMGRAQLFNGVLSIAAAIFLSGVIGVVAGIFLGITILLVGYFFVTLVAPSVQTWVNRSILGEHEGQILPFEDIATEQSSLELVFQGLVVDLWWEPVAPDATNYFDTSPASGGYLGFSIDSEARREEEKRVEDLVRINLKVRVPKFDTMDLMLEFTPHNRPETIVGWSYQKNRGNEALVSDSGFSATQGGTSSEKPEFMLKEKEYIAEWSQVYDKKILTRSVDLVVKFRSVDTHALKNDVLTINIEDNKS